MQTTRLYVLGDNDDSCQKRSWSSCTYAPESESGLRHQGVHPGYNCKDTRPMQLFVSSALPESDNSTLSLTLGLPSLQVRLNLTFCSR